MELNDITNRLKERLAANSKEYRNTSYGNVDADGKRLNAPFMLNNKSGCTEAEYNAEGYYRVNAAWKPDEREGYSYRRNGLWRVEENECRPCYTETAIPPEPDPKPYVTTQEDYDAAMEEHLTQEREERGYTTREPSEYAGSSVVRWAQDAADWIAHRDAVMVYALGVINAYAQTGVAPTLDEFRSALPKIAWTYTEG